MEMRPRRTICAKRDERKAASVGIVNNCQSWYTSDMPTMNVNLSEDLVKFISEQTGKGGYTNQSEVVREGLRLLRSRLEQKRALLRSLAAGHADAQAGSVKPLTDDLLRSIAARGGKKARNRH